MNEPNPPSVAPATAAAPRRIVDSTARVLGVCAIALGLVTTWLAWEVRSNPHAVETSAGTRIAELGQEATQSKATISQVQSSLRDTQARIAELEGQVAESKEQRVALVEMYRDLARSADDRLL